MQARVLWFKALGLTRLLQWKMASIVTCPKPMKATSEGVFQGNNPLHYALPLVILQICLVLVLTRVLAYFLKPLRQPRVIAEIIVSFFDPIFKLNNCFGIFCYLVKQQLAIMSSCTTIGFDLVLSKQPWIILYITIIGKSV